MNAPNPVMIAVDQSRNLVKIAFMGHIGLEEIQTYEREVAATLATTKPEFMLLTDLTELHTMDIECAPFIRRTMDQFCSHGVTRIVRIIPNRRKDIGFNIMSLFHYSRSVQIITCMTRAEADRALE